MDQTIAAALLRQLADLVEAMAPREFHTLLDATKASRSTRRPSGRNIRPAGSDEADHDRAWDIVRGLEASSSRAEAFNLIETRQPTKRVLILSAKSRDVYVAKTDTVADLKVKLVENIVGAKLDSLAIRQPSRAI